MTADDDDPLGMFPSSRAWRGQSFDSLVDNTLILLPGSRPANDDTLLAHLSSSVLAPCYLPRDISLIYFTVVKLTPKLQRQIQVTTHRLVKSPLLPSVFSTWILRRCTPPLAQTPGHTASVCYPVSEPVLHTTSTAASQPGLGISCCLFSENICPDQPLLCRVSSDDTHKSSSGHNCIISCNHHVLLTTDVIRDMCGNLSHRDDH